MSYGLWAQRIKNHHGSWVMALSTWETRELCQLSLPKGCLYCIKYDAYSTYNILCMRSAYFTLKNEMHGVHRKSREELIKTLYSIILVKQDLESHL